jgi:hypothetical protein
MTDLNEAVPTARYAGFVVGTVKQGEAVLPSTSCCWGTPPG